MIKISSSTNSNMTGVVHLHLPSEISTLTELEKVDIVGNEVAIIERTDFGNVKMKVQLSSLFGSGTDPNAVHRVDAPNEINLLDSTIPNSLDIILIENEDSSPDQWLKNKVSFGDITMDILSDGANYVRMETAERTKLADITSSGSDIADTVSKRHVQGTDTTLGVLTQDIDLGSSYKVINSIEPTLDTDLATKYYVDNHSGGGEDPNAIHVNLPNEINGIDEELSPTGSDILVIENQNSSPDQWSKNKIAISSITMDVLSDGTNYVRMESTERTKLADITSSGSDIADAVSKRHVQGTDITLGIQSQNSDWGTYRITNAGEPIDSSDYATKNYVDNSATSFDPNAVHVNQPDEINNLTLKNPVVPTDCFLIEDSQDGWNKKKAVLPTLSSKYDIAGFEEVYDSTPASYDDWPYSCVRQYNVSTCSYNKIWYTSDNRLMSIGIEDNLGIKSLFFTRIYGSPTVTIDNYIIDSTGITIVGNPNLISTIDKKTYVVCDSSDLQKKIISFSGSYPVVATITDLVLMTNVDENPTCLSLNQNLQNILIGTGSPSARTCKIIRGVNSVYTITYENGHSGIVSSFCKVSSSKILATIYNDLTNESHIIESTDDGVSWIDYLMQPFKIDKLVSIGDNQLLCKSDNTIIISYDNGVTWMPTPLLDAGLKTIKDFIYLGYGIICVVGGEISVSSNYWISFDKGATWTSDNLNGYMADTINSVFWYPYYMQIGMCCGNDPGSIFVMQFNF